MLSEPPNFETAPSTAAAATSTTPTPSLSFGSPWTTVFPNYGPSNVNIFNPKVLVHPDKKPTSGVLRKTVYESRVVGPLGDWNGEMAGGGGGIPLHYTSSPRSQTLKYSKAYRPGGFDVCWETMIGQVSEASA